MKLDEYELDYVKYFIQVKGYHQYEVLAEIMDHFILLLEEKKSEKPTEKFEDLVDSLYESEGKIVFKQINKAAKRKVFKKYNRLFFGHLMVFLHYKYVLFLAMGCIVLYYLQYFIQHYTNIFILQSLITATIYFFVFRFTAVTDGNFKYMSTKITRRYGFGLLICVVVVLGTLNRVLIKNTYFGFNLSYLVSTLILVVMAVILYALVRTARMIAQESDELDEIYQVLK